MSKACKCMNLNYLHVFGLQKTCSRFVKAMLLDCKSNALARQKACSWTSKGMLLESKNMKNRRFSTNSSPKTVNEHKNQTIFPPPDFLDWNFEMSRKNQTIFGNPDKTRKSGYKLKPPAMLSVQPRMQVRLFWVQLYVRERKKRRKYFVFCSVCRIFAG